MYNNCTKKGETMQYFGRKTQKVTFLSVPEKKAHVLFSGMMTAVVAIFVLAAFFLTAVPASAASSDLDWSGDSGQEKTTGRYF